VKGEVQGGHRVLSDLTIGGTKRRKKRRGPPKAHHANTIEDVNGGRVRVLLSRGEEKIRRRGRGRSQVARGEAKVQKTFRFRFRAQL